MFAAASLLLSDAAPAAELPAFEASFRVRYGVLSGEMRLALKRKGDGYAYLTVLRPTGFASWFRRGSIVERTVVEVIDGAIVPREYEKTDTIAKPARSTTYAFARGRVTGQYKTQTIDAPMQEHGQNRISVHVAVMQALIDGADVPAYPIFDRARWKAYRFTVVGRDRIDTPAGAFDTIEVRYTDEEDDERWSLHFAPAVGYLPVAVLFYEGDDLKSKALLTTYRIAAGGG